MRSAQKYRKFKIFRVTYFKFTVFYAVTIVLTYHIYDDNFGYCECSFNL